MANNQSIEKLKTNIYNFIIENSGIIMKDFYNNFQGESKSLVNTALNELIETNKVVKMKAGRTVKLCVVAKSPNKYLKKLEKQVEAVTSSKIHDCENIELPNWYIGVSFKKSTSKNYSQAVALSRLGLNYEEKMEDTLIHHSSYTKDSRSFLIFMNLYNIIKDWNSCRIEINNKFLFQKSLDTLTECYCNKCKSSPKDSFCSGYNLKTANPFECHRLNINIGGTPWWKYGYYDAKCIWHIDKEDIRKTVNENSYNLNCCPDFSNPRCKIALNKIPDMINPNINKNWIKVNDSIEPKDEEFALLVSKNLEAASLLDISKFTGNKSSDINPNLDSNFSNFNTSNNSTNNINYNSGCGCLFLIIIVIVIFAYIFS
ncbi:hypothetical protein HBE96_17070 [Clostridium sp. P21]|uniref:Uncharacterized protein n=1 Tax=Clostridium muellerianum TaxID=2716538 RepID=A0A7Y0HQ36_9CLOT|nr:hypothetical protein [Clostridium muellerianum]NMM64337.1 hypothetical protein [Clostridium muellerianum]